jgi:uncharacterized protein (DUF58 family)
MSGGLRTAALGACLCLLAGAFAVPSLYVPGVALVLLAAAASASVRLAMRSAHVGLELDAERVEEGERLALAVCLEGRLARVSAAWLRATPEMPYRRLDARSRVMRLELRPRRRGRVTVGPATVRYRDPFGICARERRSTTRELLVLPRIDAVPRGELRRLLTHPAAANRRDRGLDFDGLGAYRPGAPASRIHWLTVARTGTLVERRSPEEEARADVMIVLDARAPDSLEALDAAVRAAASLCVGLARVCGCSILLPGQERAHTLRADLAGWPHVHAQLALVEAGRAPAWRGAGDARRVVLVQGRRPEAAELGGGLVVCSVSPLPAERRATIFTVAGCAVQPANTVRAVRAA